VVCGGRSFIRNIIDLITKVKCPHHHVRITPAAKSDILWWVTCLFVFHGIASFSCDQALPSYEFSTDACLSGGRPFWSVMVLCFLEERLSRISQVPY
jgi:hypothetical protein